MNPEFYVQIAKPCHENWDNMSPVAKGKFCSSCSKELVDFSLLSDAEVLNYFKKTTGETCGRFHSDQLKRPLLETKIEKRKGLQWLMASIASLLMISKSNAQKDPFPLGKIKMIQPKDPLPKKRMIVPGKEKTVDKKVNAVTRITGGEIMGDVSLIPKNPRLPILDIVKPVVVSLVVNTEIKPMSPTMQPATPVSECRYMTLGGSILVSSPPIKTIKKDTFFLVTARKMLDTMKTAVNPLKIYPNPALKNSVIHIETKETGTYLIQLFDNASRLLVEKSCISNTKKQVTDFQLPGNAGAGYYYVKLTNVQTKKTHTDKIILQ